MFKSINPFDQQVIAEFAPDDSRSITKKLDRASSAFGSWRNETFARRSQLMQRAGQLLRQNRQQLATLIAREMGKVLGEASAEIDKCANACDYYAQQAEQFLRDEPIQTEAAKSFIAYQPLGPVLAIMPWNFPFWQVFRFAVPTLMAGNTALLKHAANVCGCSRAISNIFTEAGFPEGVFQSLYVDSGAVEGIISQPAVAAVTLTGSEYAGTQVAAAAGRNLKKTVLELGGSDPFIVLDDADIDLAAKIATQSRMQNAGQSCIAAKRFIVVKPVKDVFVDAFRKNIESLKQGNPLEPDTTTGPVARIDLAEGLEAQLKSALNAGAQLVTGGMRDRCNFQPALIDHVKPGNPAFEEEIFGPIASVTTAKDDGDAIRLANQNKYGLGGSVWTRDPARGEQVARAVESGAVFVNSLMRSDQRLPFGGIKRSGYGRELSELGIKEFVNAKTIYIA